MCYQIQLLDHANEDLMLHQIQPTTLIASGSEQLVGTLITNTAAQHLLVMTMLYTHFRRESLSKRVWHLKRYKSYIIK